MTYVLALFAQFLHIALMLALAPLLTGLEGWVQATLSGRAGPAPWLPWRDLARLVRKQAVLAENASPVLRAAPLACVAAMLVAASLVPSFILGMTLAPLSDLLVIGGLLAVGRVALALAALDPGIALSGLGASRTASLACLAEPATFLAFLALGFLAGTTNLDLLVGLEQQGMLQPPAAMALAATALLLLALAASEVPPGQTAEFSGGDLALITLAEALRRLVWFNLIGALFLPIGIAGPSANLLAWMLGLLAWAVKLAAMSAGLAALRCAIGRQLPRRAPQMLGIAAMLGLLAALLVLASAVAA